MQFAISLPWWALALLAVAVGVTAWAVYAGAIVPLARGQRAALVALRAVVLLVLVACLLRPVRVIPPDTATDAVVAVLVDVSRSMSLPDGGRTRIETALDLLQQIRPAIQARFRPEVWTFGASLSQPGGDAIAADQGRTDLSGALRALRERYRERPVAAVVLISDGGDTSTQDAAAAVDDAGVPVYAVGVGATRVAPDFEVVDVSAGPATLTDSSVDLTVAAVSRGSADPFDLRVLENGRPVDVRRVAPAGDGSPVRAVFTVSPPRETATVYTVEIPTASGEVVLENNRRSVLVEPPGRRRRVLMVEGAPGFEHTFIKRALAGDPGIELDSVVRKGRDAQGHTTFFVQAAEDRAPRLASGFPTDRAALFKYDALVLANVEPDALSRAQLETAAEFVGARGGGLLVLGAKSFAREGLVGTPLEQVLPLGLTDRGSGVVRASTRDGSAFAVSVTTDGEAHPVMRIAASPEETAKRWRAVPALAGAAALGSLRPGAQVLALVQAPDGPRPLVAVQRYGQGRSLVFTGEASWRWRMQMPSEDRTFELFWRQVVRWLSTTSSGPVSMAPLTAFAPGGTETINVDVRDEAFAAVSDAEVAVRVVLPGGDTQDVHMSVADPRTGRYSGDLHLERPGIYRFTAAARRGGSTIGSAERWALVGGADLEMSDPRLNEEVLRRVAGASGGAYLTAGDVSRLPGLLEDATSERATPRLEELWHNPWMFLGVVGLLAAEWTLRRRWGLR